MINPSEHWATRVKFTTPLPPNLAHEMFSCAARVVLKKKGGGKVNKANRVLCLMCGGSGTFVSPRVHGDCPVCSGHGAIENRAKKEVKEKKVETKKRSFPFGRWF